jgi:cytochrome c-type biogenesis protein CcmH
MDESRNHRGELADPPLRSISLPILIMALSLAAALWLAVEAKTARAQGGDNEELPPGVTWDQVNTIAHKMYCDVCEGIPLDECESVACREWRQEIAVRLSQGYTEDEIIDYFVQRYGTDVAALPRDKSDLRLVFAIPAAIVLLMGLVGAVQVRKLRQRGQQPGQVVRRSGNLSQSRPVPDDIDPDILARLEHELEELEA